MSRAYRIRVSETLRKILKAEDHVRTHLEILNVLPKEETAELLAAELQRRGFEQQGELLVREQEDIRIVVDPSEGAVIVEAAACEEVELSAGKDEWIIDENKQHAKEIAKKKLQKALEDQASHQKEELQSELTDQLEAQLLDLRKELDQISNQVTAAALKKKAARMGQIKEISEDAESGSLTIVLEV